MNSKSLALGGVVVVLAGLASWVGAHLAQPAAPPSAEGGDVRTHLEEIERRLGYIEQRLGAAERTAAEARDLAEALRDRTLRGGTASPPDAGPGVAPGPGGAGDPPPVKAPGNGGDAGAPGPTDEELRVARVKDIQDTLRRHARTMVPAILSQLADTAPRAVETRRRDAMISARQMAVALGVSGDQADQLHELFTENAERTARDVGPLVKDGLAKADIAAVEQAFEAAWTDLDRQAKEIVGDAKFARFSENAGSMRTLIRDVLGDYRKR